MKFGENVMAKAKHLSHQCKNVKTRLLVGISKGRAG